MEDFWHRLSMRCRHSYALTVSTQPGSTFGFLLNGHAGPKVKLPHSTESGTYLQNSYSRTVQVTQP